MRPATFLRIAAVLGVAILPACPNGGSEVPDGGGVPDSGVPDGGGPDEPDAMPNPDGAPADLVLGQPDMASSDPNAGGESLGSLNAPIDVATDGTHIWIADGRNVRVLQWDVMPAENGAAADHVIGQLSGTSHTPGLSDRILGATVDGVARIRVFSDGTRLFVSDWANNRVLVWNAIPDADGTPADLVIGQPDFTSKVGGADADNLVGPAGVWSDGSMLIVADSGNSRVLIWPTFPSSNGEPADIVLGRSDFGSGSGDEIEPISASSTHFPMDVVVSGGRLFVADTNNHRVLIWNTIPSTNGAPADVVVGQSDFEGELPNAGQEGPSATTLDAPESIAVDGDVLVVADRQNGRVVVFDSIPTTNGAAASRVFGQPDLETELPAGSSVSPTPDRLFQPRGVALDGPAIYVSDEQWNRVLRFTME